MQISLRLSQVIRDVTFIPVDLDKEDFEIYRDGIKYTVRLNRKNKLDFGTVVYVYFDVIKAEFSGGLPQPEEIDDYIELKPKGA